MPNRRGRQAACLQGSYMLKNSYLIERNEKKLKTKIKKKWKRNEIKMKKELCKRHREKIQGLHSSFFFSTIKKKKK